MFANPFFRLTVVVILVLLLIFQQHCPRLTDPPLPSTSAEPSRELARVRHADGTETTTFSVASGEKDEVIRRLRERASHLAHDSMERRRLAQLLLQKPHVQAATVVTTRVPCPAGDSTATVTTGVAVREEKAAGVLGFLKPRELRLDVTQFTPGATTLFSQSYVAPPLRPRRFGLGVFAGYAVGPDFKPHPVIGAGLSYNLATF